MNFRTNRQKECSHDIIRVPKPKKMSSSSATTKFTRSRHLDKPSSSKTLRYRDSKPSLPVTKSHVDVKVKPSTSKSNVPMPKPLLKPPVVAAKSSDSRYKNLLKDVKLTETKKKIPAKLPTRKPSLPAPSVSPQLKRRMTLTAQTKPSISSQRSSTGISSLTTRRRASVIASKQISQQMSEIEEDFDVQPALSSKIPSIRQNPPSISSKQPLLKLERHVTPAVSELVEETDSFRLVLDKLPVEDPHSCFSVQIVEEENCDVFLLTPLKKKRNARSNPEEANPSDRTRTPTRLPRSCSKIASYQEQNDDISWDSSQKETGTPKSSRVTRGRSRVHNRETEEGKKEGLVTPSAFKRDCDVTFETEVRPTLKKQRVMVPLRLQLEDATIVEENNSRENTQFYTPQRICESEERDLDEAEEARSTEMSREMLPYNHDAEQRKAGWRCIVM